jgi:hypothetical protein
MNFADPPPASPPPVPEVVWQTTQNFGLEQRNYRERDFVKKKSARARRAAAARSGGGGGGGLAGGGGGAGGAGGGPGGGGGGFDGGGGGGYAPDPRALLATQQRRRELLATPYRLGGTASNGSAPSTSAGGDGRIDASGGHGAAGYGFGGIGLARKITGRNTGFDGIGVPETRLVPEDLSLAVGNTAAIHTANSMIRFYRVDVTGKKAKHGGVLNPKDNGGTFLKQVWLADFFYPVGWGAGFGGGRRSAGASEGREAGAAP